MKYFKESEFECDGVNCFQEMDSNLLVMLEEARNISETPFNITSSFRTEEHNEKIGGKMNSSHLRGCAVDIACDNSSKRLVILDALIIAGFTRIGIAKTFIHCDNDMSLPQEVLWTY